MRTIFLSCLVGLESGPKKEAGGSRDTQKRRGSISTAVEPGWSPQTRQYWNPHTTSPKELSFRGTPPCLSFGVWLPDLGGSHPVSPSGILMKSSFMAFRSSEHNLMKGSPFFTSAHLSDTDPDLSVYLINVLVPRWSFTKGSMSGTVAFSKLCQSFRVSFNFCPNYPVLQL